MLHFSPRNMECFVEMHNIFLDFYYISNIFTPTLASPMRWNGQLATRSKQKYYKNQHLSEKETGKYIDTLQTLRYVEGGCSCFSAQITVHDNFFIFTIRYIFMTSFWKSISLLLGRRIIFTWEIAVNTLPVPFRSIYN